MRNGIWKYMIVAMLLVAGGASGQSAAEQQAKTYLDQIQYWRYQYSPEDSGVDPNAKAADSVLHFNRLLVNHLQQNPSLLRANFKTDGENAMTIATSDDKKVRLYSWDTETGDEMHIYDAIIQYEAGGAKSKVLKDISLNKDNKQNPGALYPEIFMVDNGKKYYLVVSSAIVSSKDAKKGVHVYTIENNELTEANIFPGGVNKVEYTYDYYSNYDYKDMKENKVIHMDKGKLYVPVVEGDKINDKWRVYRFENGKLVLE